MPPARAEIEIEASADRVFEAICDLDRYPEWNRFTPWISLASRDLRVGAELDLDCWITERKLLRGEREVILELDRERRVFAMGTSRTRGRPGIRSRRTQRCEPLGPGRCRFTNGEEFSGPLAPLVRLLYQRKLERAFARYCGDLKAWLERGA